MEVRLSTVNPAFKSRIIPTEVLKIGFDSAIKCCSTTPNRSRDFLYAMNTLINDGYKSDFKIFKSGSRICSLLKSRPITGKTMPNRNFEGIVEEVVIDTARKARGFEPSNGYLTLSESDIDAIKIPLKNMSELNPAEHNYLRKLQDCVYAIRKAVNENTANELIKLRDSIFKNINFND